MAELPVALIPRAVTAYLPNLGLLMQPTSGGSYPVPFDVYPINPNNLGQYVVTPAGPLVGGLLGVNVTPVSENMHAAYGSAVTSAVTTRYDVPYAELAPWENSVTFAIKGK